MEYSCNLSGHKKVKLDFRIFQSPLRNNVVRASEEKFHSAEPFSKMYHPIILTILNYSRF